ncbi:MAG: HAMP domain-containing histidine kinase [Clostridiaceae bacterium]|nr:HAMP domain-containing histidine kinase [Clostridiaceae bacterium]
MVKEEVRLTGKLNKGSSTGRFFINRRLDNRNCNGRIYAKSCINKSKSADDMNNVALKNVSLAEKTKELTGSDWVSALSHEFRTPLNVILSTLQVALMNTSGEQENEYSLVKSKYLRIMRQNCLRLMKMVNNLIDINRIDSDFFNIDPKNEDIVRIAWLITNSVTEYAGAKNIKVSFETNKQECIIASDTFQLERILLNLLSNAIKFTPGGGKIHVELVVMPEKVYISVSDTGQGIAPQYQKTIFEYFGQTDGKTYTEKKGSGLGLYLVKRLLDRMSSKIWVTSKEGQGSKFTFYLPNYRLPQSVKEDKHVDYQSHRVERLQIEFSDIYVG